MPSSTSKTLENWGSSLIPEHYALTLLTFKDTASPFLIHVILNPVFFFPQMKQYIFNFFVYKLLVSPVVCEKVAPCVPICVAFHPLLINLPPFADSFVSSTRNRFQLFMPIFHKYLGDGISKQTMPGDTNPRLQQRSFNALEIWPAVDRHLLLSSAASQQQCWHSKYVYRSGAALTLRWGAGIRLKERSEE